MKSRTSALCHRTRAFRRLSEWSAGFIHHSSFTIHFSRFALCLLTAALLCTSCARRETPADLVILNGGEPESLDASIISGQLDGRVVLALYEGLMRYDPVTAKPIHRMYILQFYPSM